MSQHFNTAVMYPTLIQLQTPSAVKKHLTLSHCKQTAGSRPHDPTNAQTCHHSVTSTALTQSDHPPAHDITRRSLERVFQ